VENIRRLFESRGRTMSENNTRQADVPQGATTIPPAGTAPGLICAVGQKVIYALPGVPYEMAEMFVGAVLPDLRRRLDDQGAGGTIASRVLRTWGLSESALAELLAPHVEALDAGPGNTTIAFLASGMEGIKVRITAKASDTTTAAAILAEEEALVREVTGDAVFGVDAETMESVVGSRLAVLGLTLGLAESLTGGLVASRLVSVPGASTWLRGSIVAYSPEVKFSILGVPEGPVVTESVARAMAEGARRVLGADIGLALTGVAGPDESEGRSPGTVIIGLALPGSASESLEVHLPGDRERIRQYATISALDLLRRKILSEGAGLQGTAGTPGAVLGAGTTGLAAKQVHV
jgi:nicotinamide-nucleotide amidase